MRFRWSIDLKLIIFFLISLGSLAIFYYVEDKAAFINFFFIPTLLAGYFYTTKGGAITAITSILFVCIVAFMSFEDYIGFIRQEVLLWGCFLIVSSYIIGTLTERINAAHLATITTLALAMESRDTYTYGHSSRVAEIAVRIARKLKLPKSQQRTIRIAGMLHDIGKFGIKEDILRKRGALTDDEYDHVQQHPFIGTSILSSVRLLKDTIPYIYYHHEHVDGKGYLHKIGSEIPLGARILAVADAYDAMMTNRPYRKALSREKVLEIFFIESGRQFDQKVVKVLLEITDDITADISPPEPKGMKAKISL